MKYRDIQPVHEESVLDSFAEFLSSRNIEMVISERPDPPDALVTINHKETWIEITDAFMNSEWAKSITSYAADDRPHQPYKGGVIIGPDDQACCRVKEVILKKYNKSSIKAIAEKRGPGILLVGVYTPLTLPEEIVELGKAEITEAINKCDNIFQAIYLYKNTENGHDFVKLL